ncbi:MAG: transposon resolvase [Arthrobacter sp.]|nr:transposon resolvase [Arthrobacter sp.]
MPKNANSSGHTGGARPDRRRVWRPTPPPAPIPADTAATDIRVGYARCSHLTPELQSQLDALEAHGIGRDTIFAEKVSTRVRVRPKFEAALELCRQIKAHATGISRCVEDTVREASWPGGRHPDRQPPGALFHGPRKGFVVDTAREWPSLSCAGSASGIAFLPVTGSCRRRRIVLDQERRPAQRHSQGGPL